MRPAQDLAGGVWQGRPVHGVDPWWISHGLDGHTRREMRVLYADLRRFMDRDWAWRFTARAAGAARLAASAAAEEAAAAERHAMLDSLRPAPER